MFGMDEFFLVLAFKVDPSEAAKADRDPYLIKSARVQALRTRARLSMNRRRKPHRTLGRRSAPAALRSALSAKAWEQAKVGSAPPHWLRSSRVRLAIGNDFTSTRHAVPVC
jgi:hypothetical protein